MDEIARNTEIFTGAELEELVLRAARNALKEDRDYVTSEDFKTAMESFRINWGERRRQMEEYLELSEKFCNDMRFLQRLTHTVSSRLEALKKQLDSP